MWAEALLCCEEPHPTTINTRIHTLLSNEPVNIPNRYVMLCSEKLWVRQLERGFFMCMYVWVGVVCVVCVVCGMIVCGFVWGSKLFALACFAPRGGGTCGYSGFTLHILHTRT